MITLTTDLDPVYVAQMKGAMLELNPNATIIDISHDVGRFNVRRASFVLMCAARAFPRNTVHVCVVDPGVGSSRNGLIVDANLGRFVGPDNGVFTLALEGGGDRSSYAIQPGLIQQRTNRPISSTFHGRDIFAPAAARLASGEEPEKLGPPAADLVRFTLPRLEIVEGPAVHGEILHQDHFGNLITTLGHLRIEEEDMLLEPWLPHCAPARLPRPGLCLLLPNGAQLELKATYGDVAAGEALAYVGSDGLLEIGINQGRAAEALPLKPGQEVILGYQRRTTA